MLNNREDAYRLLMQLGAPSRLIVHLQLVSEAADQLIHAYEAIGLDFDSKLIELGVAVHDAGKIEYRTELESPGSLHEAAGEKLLLVNGVQADVAHCCISHAAWNQPGVSFEEKTIALADKLWKGKREPDLELMVIDEIALRLGRARWDVFPDLDMVFERIAAGGTERLERSRAP
jgi:hypothetical protein